MTPEVQELGLISVAALLDQNTRHAGTRHNIQTQSISKQYINSLHSTTTGNHHLEFPTVGPYILLNLSTHDNLDQLGKSHQNKPRSQDPIQARTLI